MRKAAHTLVGPLAALWLAAGFGGGGSGCSDTSIIATEPRIELSHVSIEFGGVNLGTPESVTVEVRNVGSGDLEVTSLELTPDSPTDVFEFTSPPERVRPGDPGVFQVTFIPDDETAFTGTLRIRSDSVEDSVLDVPLHGTGAVPDLKVTPTTITFVSGGPTTEEFTLESEGSGTVLVEAIDLFDQDGVFAVVPAAGHQAPFELAPGESLDVTVSYAAQGDGPHSGEVIVSSNDRETPAIRVGLTAEGDGNTGCEPPEVEVLAPDSGTTVHAGDPVLFDVRVTDSDEPVEYLLVSVRSDIQAPPVLWSGAPAVDGAVQFTTDLLVPGTHTITVTAQDSDLCEGQETVRVIVWQDGDTFVYAISGEEGGEYTYFGVDDDLQVWLTDGEGTRLIFQDANGELDNTAPIVFEASPGDQVRIVATDALAYRKRLDPTWLNLIGGGASQPLNTTAIWVTGYRETEESVPDCGEEGGPDWVWYEGPCYDAGHTGPWPVVFYDETFVIGIPS